MAIKLSISQVNALTSEIVDRILSAQKDKKEKQKEQEDLLYSKYLKKYPILQELSEKVPHSKGHIQIFLEQKFPDKFEESKLYNFNQYVERERIKNKLIVETIEGDNIDKVVQAIVNSYVNPIS